ncbi:hypothetical protein [Pedobacter metabolipauper]|uniref:Uncharacterized protein n=1 Tax=Pedobacter metabolipauper TaxID=425513 RepID=A0A4R6T1T6_9SPHI|nr:hypothetical protein [Pedobacter metabolipauper]TDQ11291.1 hypothetical protein ATK78_0409 [Pedobacter metabolipauper]
MAKLKIKTLSSVDTGLSSRRNHSINGNFKVSFQYLDKTQQYGSDFKDWQKEGLLSKAMEVLQGYCCSPLVDQIDGHKFAIYGRFPKITHTRFELPKNISEDAVWGRIHVTGIAILAGHIIEDTFYIVFLDKTHKFYITQRNRTKKDQ